MLQGRASHEKSSGAGSTDKDEQQDRARKCAPYHGKRKEASRHADIELPHLSKSLIWTNARDHLEYSNLIDFIYMGKKRIIQEAAKGVQESLAATAEAAPLTPSKGEKTGKKMAQIGAARIYVKASYNNTLISLTDARGNVLVWSSAGALGFKGPKKATPYVESKIVEKIFADISKN